LIILFEKIELSVFGEMNLERLKGLPISNSFWNHEDGDTVLNILIAVGAVCTPIELAQSNQTTRW